MSSSATGAGVGNKIPSGYQHGQLQQFTPEMMQLFQSLFSHLGPESYLSKLAGGDEETFKQMERPALQQFAGLQGGLASKFSGMGQGARRSSGFQNTSNQYASDFASQLQSQRQGLQREALTSLFGLGGMLLGQKPYEQFLTEDPWIKMLGMFGQGLGQGIGQLPALLG